MLDLSGAFSSLLAFLTGTTYGSPTGIVVSVGLALAGLFMAKQKNYSLSELLFGLAGASFLLTVWFGGG